MLFSISLIQLFSSLTSLSNVLQFLMYSYCIYFIKFISEYFTLLDIIGNGILISFSNCLLLIYRNTTLFLCIDFTQILLNSLIGFRSFHSIPYGFLVHITFPVNRVLLIFYSVCYLFICSFVCLSIVLAKISRRMLYSNSKTGHPCLVLDLRKKALFLLWAFHRCS